MLQNVRGTRDLAGLDLLLYNKILGIASDISLCYSYSEISTPILEYASVFQKTLGETSDIVSKETYTFEDREKRSLILRPEFTAAVARAVISGGMTQNMPLKLFSHGSLFRHERPQRGRYREFHQLNFEFLGEESPFADAELLYMLKRLIDALGITNSISLQINTIGDSESREAYKNALTKYLYDKKNNLSKESLIRLEKNVLRVLDSKSEEDIETLKNAPSIMNYLNKRSSEFYERLLDLLDFLGMQYTQNSKLVRGMDYYSHTVFEFTTESLGAQSAVIAGGRYDNLFRMMDPKVNIPAVGAAAGIERLMELIGQYEENNNNTVSVITLGQEKEGLKLAVLLRGLGIKTDMLYLTPLKKCMKKASRARFAVIIGEDEVRGMKYKIKDMNSGEEVLVECASVPDYLSAKLCDER